MSHLRRARPDEAGKLTDLAMRSKAHWGYDAGFMEQAARELTIEASQVASHPFYVLEDAGDLLGFYGLGGEPPTLTLDYLFVEPERIGGGLGRRLWEHAVATARELGARSLELESDPNAEAFYRARGAERVGEVLSSIPGRRLPYMRLPLGPA